MMQQQTQEWHDLRKTKVGASDAPVIMGVSRLFTITELWEEKVGLSQRVVTSPYAQRGLDLEDEARDYFYLMTGIRVYPDVLLHPDYNFMMASVDGISSDKKTLVEIKCPGKTVHQMALNGKIPKHYYPQLQHQLSVCNLDKAFYLSYDGTTGVILEVIRDDNYLSHLIKIEQKFYHCVEKFIPPDEEEFKLIAKLKRGN